jgi:hypothetical protein
MIPSPHPLDFDWRFDESTIERLTEVLRGHRPIALGAPSVARRLEVLGEPVLLVDRQPLQDVRNHIVADIREGLNLSTHHAIALADPPWYPSDVIAWAEVAGRLVGCCGEVLLSVWPPDVRPGSELEYEDIVRRFSRWSTVELEPWSPTYHAPPFEVASPHQESIFSRSPRIGRMLRLKVTAPPRVSPLQPSGRLWHRVTADGYQLALKVRLSRSQVTTILCATPKVPTLTSANSR